MFGVGGCNNAEQPPVPSPLRAYQSVLQNKAEFFSTDINGNLNISQLSQTISSEEVTVDVTSFAVIDIGHGGTPAVILSLNVNGNDYGFEVLSYQDGTVYGYTFSGRQFGDLRTDGSFVASGGASDVGICTITFDKSTYSIDKFTFCESSTDSNYNISVSYFVNHQSATEDEYNAAFSRWQKIPHVTWYDFTDDNVKTMLKAPVDDILSQQGTPNTLSTPDTIQLTCSVKDFSNIPLDLLNDNEIGSIVNSKKIDDAVTYVGYIPKEFNEENPEGYIYSYIEVAGTKYALSRSLGETWYDLTKTTLAEAEVYSINEIRGASYGVTIFFVIKEKTPYVISEIDGFAQISDIDESGTKEAVSTVGTVPGTSIHFFDFDKQTVSIANINEQSGATYSMYDLATNTFSLAFEPNQNPVTYVYETNELLRVE